MKQNIKIDYIKRSTSYLQKWTEPLISVNQFNQVRGDNKQEMQLTKHYVECNHLSNTIQEEYNKNIHKQIVQYLFYTTEQCYVNVNILIKGFQ